MAFQKHPVHEVSRPGLSKLEAADLRILADSFAVEVARYSAGFMEDMERTPGSPSMPLLFTLQVSHQKAALADADTTALETLVCGLPVSLESEVTGQWGQPIETESCFWVRNLDGTRYPLPWDAPYCFTVQMSAQELHLS